MFCNICDVSTGYDIGLGWTWEKRPFAVPVHWSSKFLLQGEGIRMTMAFQRMSHYFAELKPGSLVLEAWCAQDPKRFAPAKETKLIGFWAFTRYCIFFNESVSCNIPSSKEMTDSPESLDLLLYGLLRRTVIIPD
jgi:hypothetical protein